MEYCEKHNRNMLLSKFPDRVTGEKKYWCPDCYKERKGGRQGGFPPAVPPKVDGSAIIMDELAAINKKLDDIIEVVYFLRSK